MIRVTPLGQWGNQLHQICIGKMLAERTGQMFVPFQFLNKSGGPLKWNTEPFIRPPATAGQRDGLGPLIINTDHWFDMNSVFPGWEINATGFFQRWEIYAPYKDKIRNEWLKIHANFVPTDDDAVYIHVRRTDYLGDHLTPERNCQATTLDEYAACLRHFPNATVAEIVTDDIDDPFIEELVMMIDKKFSLDCEVARHPWDVDWLKLASCRNLIMSQSTYSWWAAFLGRATKIVCPVFPSTFWGKGYRLMGPPKDGRDFPNLEVTDDPGKEWIWVRE